MTIAPFAPADALDDADLAVAAAGGNQLAFSAIYDRYADLLCDCDAAADCVQDVFVTAATKLVQLLDPNRLRAWLYASGYFPNISSILSLPTWPGFTPWMMAAIEVELFSRSGRMRW